MNTTTFSSYDVMCRQAAREILEDLAANPRQMLCIAAGNTSLGIFKYLIEAYREGSASFAEAYFVAMDEWLHMNAETPDSCGNFLVENFLKHVDYPSEHIRLWDGCRQDTEKECREVEAFIQENSTGGTIDFLVLGMGMNGHLALNEPGTDLTATAHVCTLDPVTQRVGQKYFQSETALTGGITLGIGNFRQARRTILMVNGSHKAEITRKVLEAPAVTNQLPATALREFPNASFYCDAPAAGEAAAL